MNFEGQSPAYFLYYFLAAAVLLVLYILVQRFRITKLEKEVDSISLHYQKHLAASRPQHTDLLAQSPFPACIIDHSGHITGANPLFLGLVEPVKITTLDQFDRLTMGTLAKISAVKGIHSGLVTLQEKERDLLRQFMVISWPLSTTAGEQIGRVITLHEQTNIIRRKNHQAEFERELIECMKLLSVELQQTLQGGLRDTRTVQALNTELQSLADYLLTLHTSLRQQANMTHRDMVQIVKDAMQEIRPLTRRFGASCIVTLPRTSGVRVENDTFHLALTTLLTGVLEFAEQKAGTIRIHIDNAHHKQKLIITCEDLVLSEQEIQGLFTFGKMGHLTNALRNFHLRVAIVRELCEKQGIIFEADSHRDTGTICVFTVAGTPRSHTSA